MFYTFLDLASPVKHLRLFDSLRRVQLGGTPGDSCFHILELTAARDSQSIFRLDKVNGKVYRIDIHRKQFRTVFECGMSYSIFDFLYIFPGNSTEKETLAILIKSKCMPGCEIWLLEEGLEMKLQVRDGCALNGNIASMWEGKLLKMLSGVAVIKCENSILHVWRYGESEALQFLISDAECPYSGICVMENVLGRRELIALAIRNNNSIGFFALEPSGLLKVRQVQLDSTPCSLLWIASKGTLLIGENKGNKEELSALRVSERELTKCKVTIDGKHNSYANSWCVLPDMSGNEKAIAIFDYESDSVKLFALA